MIRVVLDTVVFVRSLINPRSRWARLVFEHTVDYQLVVSPPVVQEVLEVLRRPELVRRFSTLPGRDSAAVVGLLRSAELVEIDLSTFPPVSRDRKDDKFLATAKAGGAGYVVSEDEDLLVLGEFEGSIIVNAETFLAILARQP